MRNGKKKEPNIDKLTRKQLIKKCRGRGIAIGQYLAQIERLKYKAGVAGDVEELSAGYLEALGKIEDLKKVITNKDTIIEDLREEVIDSDTLLGEAQRMANNFEADNVGLRKDVTEFKRAWTNASAVLTKTEEHARELAEFYLVNIGQIINTSKLIVMGVKSIENKYKEE